MKKTNKKYIIVVLIALLAVAGVVIYNSQDTTLLATSTVTVEEKVKPAIASIEILTPYTEKEQFQMFIDGVSQSEQKWMPKTGSRGFAIQKDGLNENFVIKALNDVEISLLFRSPFERDENQKIVRNWVEYTSIKVNGEPILTGSVTVWHHKFYTYTIHAKAGETYTVEVTWQKPTEVPGE